jgi:hypothetical protein
MAGAASAERMARMFDLFMVCLLFSKSLSFAVLIRVERVVICEKGVEVCCFDSRLKGCGF